MLQFNKAFLLYFRINCNLYSCKNYEKKHKVLPFTPHLRKREGDKFERRLSQHFLVCLKKGGRGYIVQHSFRGKHYKDLSSRQFLNNGKDEDLIIDLFFYCGIRI